MLHNKLTIFKCYFVTYIFLLCLTLHTYGGNEKVDTFCVFRRGRVHEKAYTSRYFFHMRSQRYIPVSKCVLKKFFNSLCTTVKKNMSRSLKGHEFLDSREERKFVAY